MCLFMIMNQKNGSSLLLENSLKQELCVKDSFFRLFKSLNAKLLYELTMSKLKNKMKLKKLIPMFPIRLAKQSGKRKAS